MVCVSVSFSAAVIEWLSAYADIVGCGSLMKKCVQCRSPIEKMVSFVVCCGGQREYDNYVYVPKLFYIVHCDY